MCRTWGDGSLRYGWQCIANKRDYPKRAASGIVAKKIEVLNQHDQIVLVCEHLYLVQRRDELKVISANNS